MEAAESGREEATEGAAEGEEHDRQVDEVVVEDVERELPPLGRDQFVV
jgi:hypothetical protein